MSEHRVGMNTDRKRNEWEETYDREKQTARPWLGTRKENRRKEKGEQKFTQETAQTNTAPNH